MQEQLTYLKMMEEATKYVCNDKPHMNGPEDIAAFLRPLMQGQTQESFYVLLVNAKNCLLDFKRVTVGTVDAAPIHAREIFRDAIIQNASRIIVAHNHPSGDPMPSGPDIECTRKLVNAGVVLGISLMDHVVVGACTPTRSKDWVSFRESNLL